jgi:hypothetical protein
VLRNFALAAFSRVDDFTIDIFSFQVRLCATIGAVRAIVKEDQIGQLLTLLVEVQASLAPALRSLESVAEAERYGWLTVTEIVKPRFVRPHKPMPRLCWVTLSGNGILTFASSSGYQRSLNLGQCHTPRPISVRYPRMHAAASTAVCAFSCEIDARGPCAGRAGVTDLRCTPLLAADRV